jgi:hypothetical protein
LIVTIYLYTRKACISGNLVLFNSGLIVAGIPFQEVSAFQNIFWFFGGGMAFAAIAVFVKGKIRERGENGG